MDSNSGVQVEDGIDVAAGAGKLRIGKIAVVAAVIVVVVAGIVAGAGWYFNRGVDPVRSFVEIEAGSDFPQIATFLRRNNITGRFVDATYDIDMYMLGTVGIDIEIGGRVYTSYMTVTDTIAPTGTVAEQVIFIGDDILAEDFFAEITDATRVAAAFSAPVDFGRLGWQDVSITLTDEAENLAKFNSRLFIGGFLPLPQYILMGDEADARGFVEAMAGDVSDMLTFAFVEEPDFTQTGRQEATVIISTRNGSQLLVESELFVYEIYNRKQYIFVGGEISPDCLVLVIGGVTMAVKFAEPPDTNIPGHHEVDVILTNSDGGVKTVKSSFYVFLPRENLTAEAGSRVFGAEQLIANFSGINGIGVEVFYGSPYFDTVGTSRVIMRSGEHITVVNVNVVDTTAPTASVRNRQTFTGMFVAAQAFVYDIRDAGNVTVRYRQTPDFNRIGAQTVAVVLEDEHGNMTEYSAVLTVVHDTVPPTITGEIHRTIIVGETVNFTQRVNVTDDHDRNPTLTVDSSGVNRNVPGVYTVVYIARDASGNTTRVYGSLTVRAVDMALVNEMADDILAQILTDGMTPREQAFAIFSWVDRRVRYSVRHNPRELAMGAYYAFVRGTGDCFVYMAASQVLLNRVGIENMTIQRVGGNAEHFWNLVNLGDGWFHFDATPMRNASFNERFMFGEARAREFTRRAGKGVALYVYDASLYPTVEWYC